MARPFQNKKLSSLTQHIKVVVRVRPLNNEERSRQNKTALWCRTSEEIQLNDKTYQFDHVFHPDNTQLDVYLFVVAPMIPDVLAGYNCTVLAYGQTGSGKTHTMTGSDRTLSTINVDWKEDQQAGCIPRTAANIFDIINSMNFVEYNVRVSFLELYNEEVRDLLSPDNKLTPLNVFNDSKGSVCINGLREITVFNSNDVYELLQQGTHKRQTASTLMNNHSSRSHTVFTITVYTREATASGEELMKTGKINLVDLAGSENIAKSGARDRRAQELMNINKSLLTLGRVIQLLAEKNKHIPYRDSKLTRILQDSLGGHTKTCIIATVSPCVKSLEVTQSTLEYACRARIIRNTPTVNETITKTLLIKTMTNEIDKLRRDLEAIKLGKGLFVDRKDFEEINRAIESCTSDTNRKNEIIKEMEENLSNMENLRDEKIKQFDEIMNVCKKKNKIIKRAKQMLKELNVNLKQEKYISQFYAVAAMESSEEARELLLSSNKLSKNQEIFQKKLEQQYSNNHTNEQIVRQNAATLRDTITNSIKEEHNLNDLTAAIGKCKLSLESDKIVNASKIESLNLTLETQTRPLLDTVFEKEHASVTLLRKDFKGIFQEIENTSKECTSLAYNFTRYDQEKTSEIDSLQKQMNNVYSDLVKKNKRNERLAEELEILLNMIESRIATNNSLIDVIEQSGVLDISRKSEPSHKHNIENNLKNLENSSVSTRALQNSLDNKLRPLEKSLSAQSEEIKDQVLEVIGKDIKTVEKFVSEINTKLGSYENTMELLEESIHSHCSNMNSLMEKVDSVSNDITNIKPVQRQGDTPNHNTLTFSKTIDVLPRQILLERFKETNKEILNESFHLNVSTDSVQPLNESDETEVEH